MLVTLFVDASYFDQTKAGAYALYAISSQDTLTYAGRFKGRIDNSAHAELAAVANALHIVLPHRVAAGATRVLVQSDCQSVIDWINEPERCLLHPDVVGSIYASLGKYKVLIETRHIKAHSGIDEPRKYCHDWCDREARRLARRFHVERGGVARQGGSRSKKGRKEHRKRLVDGDRVCGTYSPMS